MKAPWTSLPSSSKPVDWICGLEVWVVIRRSGAVPMPVPADRVGVVQPDAVRVEFAGVVRDRHPAGECADGGEDLVLGRAELQRLAPPAAALAGADDEHVAVGLHRVAVGVVPAVAVVGPDGCRSGTRLKPFVFIGNREEGVLLYLKEYG
jgi:hypothetical protein